MEAFTTALIKDYPVTIELLEKFAPVFLAFMAALIASGIALGQWLTARNQERTARDKIKLEFFDKRFKVFKATRSLLDKAMVQGQILHSDLNEFYKSVDGAEFLFDGDTRDYYMKIGNMCWRAAMARSSQEKRREGKVLDKLIDEEENILEFLRNQSGKKLEDRFRKYLDLSRSGF